MWVVEWEGDHGLGVTCVEATCSTDAVRVFRKYHGLCCEITELDECPFIEMVELNGNDGGTGYRVRQKLFAV